MKKGTTITEEFFNLITKKVESPEEKDANLKCIDKLLNFSKECKELGINNLTINKNALLETRNTFLNFLEAAIFENKIEVLELLLNAGMCPNKTHKDQNQSPLCLASERNQTEMIILLLKHGADINYLKINNHNRIINPVAIAYTMQNYEALKILLLNQAQLSIPVARTTLYSSLLNLKKIEDDSPLKKMLRSAYSCQKAIQVMYGEESNNFVLANSLMLKALAHDKNYLFSTLTMITKNLNLRIQGKEHNEGLYQPHLLRLIIKNIKSHINTFYEHTRDYYSNESDEFLDLIAELNGCDVEGAKSFLCILPKNENDEVKKSDEIKEEEKNIDYTRELLFKSNNEKQKTLAWLEKGTQLEGTKSKMADFKYSQTTHTIFAPCIEETEIEETEVENSSSPHL